ncbi:RSP_7527 family protein [Streptomyces decoyicus]
MRAQATRGGARSGRRAVRSAFGGQPPKACETA